MKAERPSRRAACLEAVRHPDEVWPVTNHVTWPPNLRKGPHSTVHAYPIQIGLSAQVFTVGATFYHAFADAAVGEYLKTAADPYGHIRDMFLANGLSPEAWEENWRAFQAYCSRFPSPVFQNALFAMVSNWDWYITKLGAFLEFARGTIPDPPLTTARRRALSRIGFKNIEEQLVLLEASTSLTFHLSPDSRSDLIEMDRVRNLGMHNQWAVDEYYKTRAQRSSWELGEVRSVDAADLLKWQNALTSTIHITSTLIAAHYLSVPEFSDTMVRLGA